MAAKYNIKKLNYNYKGLTDQILSLILKGH